MQRKIAASWLLLATILVLSSSTKSYVVPSSSYWAIWNQIPEVYPEAARQFIDQLETAALVRASENAKRGFDFGLSRGHSASQTGKGLIGLDVAKYAGGPGRRRRSVQTYKRNFDFGLGRGKSGSETGQGLIGLDVANYPGGPGRKRRFVEA